MTTGNFSDEAREYVSHIDPKIALIDGQTLASLMIENDLGVATKSRYEVKQLDRDFFDEE
ncbi:MAG: restriction endonuclease [Nitrospirota bacterium]